ncbi:MAG: hypothetical protein GY913_21715 [Proteobacteria bacterium]|nr:hypothetical protein [Actinomycetes bacterium]MCP4919528.1 hypothetical protein [Pseudomonadota bacterium]
MTDPRTQFDRDVVKAADQQAHVVRTRRVVEALQELGDFLSLDVGGVEVVLPDWAWKGLRDRLVLPDGTEPHVFTDDIGDEYISLAVDGPRFTPKSE